MVTVCEHASGEEFSRRAAPLLRRDPARNGLMLSILDTITTQPDRYPRFHLWLAERDGEPVGAATITPPFNLLLAKPTDPQAIPALAAAVAAAGVQPAGINGGSEEAMAFAAEWLALTGIPAETHLRMRLHRLDAVAPLPAAAGGMRQATAADRPLLHEWLRAFAAEAGTQDDPEQLERGLTARLAQPLGMALWEDSGRVVCMAGSGPAPPSAARVGPVYTPPELRSRGYATALVAELTRRLLEGGCEYCMLYTDLANPTSNAIYARIGYRPVCDALELEFARGGQV